jgi:4-amino-4-deoxy-L-arabinose transferase-like glycosyltransferase
LWLAAWYAALGAEPWVVLFVQAFLDAGTAWVIYAVAREFGAPKGVAQLAMLLYAFEAVAIALSQQLLSETLFTFLLVAAAYLLARSLLRRSLPYAWWCGLALGAAALVRPIGLYIPLLFAPGFFLLGSAWRQRVAYFAVFAAGTLFVILPWCTFHYIRFDRFSLSTIEGYNLLTYNAARVKAREEHIDSAEALHQLEGDALQGIDNPFARADAQKRIALEYIAAHPLIYARAHLKGSINTLAGTAKSDLMFVAGIPSAVKGGSALAEGFGGRLRRVMAHAKREWFLTPILLALQSVIYALSLYGVWRAWRSERRPLAVLCTLIIAYFALTAGVVGYVRYRMPAMPFVLLLSAYGMHAVYQRVRRSGKPQPS